MNKFNFDTAPVLWRAQVCHPRLSDVVIGLSTNLDLVRVRFMIDISVVILAQGSKLAMMKLLSTPPFSQSWSDLGRRHTAVRGTSKWLALV